MIELNIPGLPKSQNQMLTAHWRVAHQEKKKWLSLMKYVLFKKELLGKKPFGYSKIIYTRHSSRQMDYDNLVSSFKYVQDALVNLSIIEGDSPKHIEALYFWEKCSRGQDHISIKIEERD